MRQDKPYYGMSFATTDGPTGYTTSAMKDDATDDSFDVGLG